MATVKDLRICAKGLGLKGFSTLNKGELEDLIGKAGGCVKTETMEVFAEPPVKVKAGVAGGSSPNTKTDIKAQNEQVPAVVVEKVRKERTKSTWNNFLSEYRVSNNCSLKNAMAAKDAYAEYKSKGSKSEPEQK